MSTTPLTDVSGSPSRPPAGSSHPLLPAWLWAPCALYAISAACILVGISKVIVPLYDKPDFHDQMEKFHCLIAMNVYEVALLGVALLILLWRQVYDDAIALTLLIAIFLIASTIALDTIAPDYPMPSLLFGLAGFLAACAKLFSLHRFITGPIRLSLLTGIVLLLGGNFFMPGLIAIVSSDRATFSDLVLPWRLGWYTALIAGVVIILAAMRIPTSAAGGDDIGKPFLRTSKMHWIVAAILLLGTITHHHALTWAFNIPIALAELTPAVGIICLIILELLRAYGYRLIAIDAMVCLVPLAATAAIALLIHHPSSFAIPLGSPSDPATALALFAGALSFNAWRREQQELQLIAAIYLVAAVMLSGVDPRLPLSMKWAEIQWNLGGFTLAAALALAAAAQRSVQLATASTLALALSCATSPWAIELAATYRISQVAMVAIVFGAVMQMVYCVFRRELPPRVALFASIALAMGVLHVFFPSHWPTIKGGRMLPVLDYPMLSGIITFGYVALVSIWTRDWHILIPASVPLIVAAFSQKEGQGWVWVGMSFVILALGGAASIRKSWREQKNDEDQNTRNSSEESTISS